MTLRRLTPHVLFSGLAYATLAVFLLPGCGGAKKTGPETVPVSGTVSHQGKPLADAKVYFFTEKFSAYGKTDAEGRYRLTNGAIPGENKVFVSKLTGDAKTVPNQIAEDPGQVEAAAAAAANDPSRPKKATSGELLPPDLSDPERTKLTFKVPAEGTETANFSF